ncbi:MAG TPA: hypothetical protein VHT30_01305, partial [Acidimicrobiales bacterium]|nr:hypothetical protein [Acidimicrobiales bacterium]
MSAADTQTTQTPRAPTAYEVRAEFEDLVEKDLLGPRDGPEEELPPGDTPAERYLLGRIVPRSDVESTAPGATVPEDEEESGWGGAEEDPDLVDREVTDAAEDLEDPEPAAVVRSGRMAASALGLSFSVPTSVDAISVTANWGRYSRVPSEIHETEQGRPRTVWKRTPVTGTWQVELQEEGHLREPSVGGQDGVELRATVRHRGRLRVVDVSLVNC